MIMIRPSANQKINKPPPPVPPRPSKNLVQEALAKSRQNNATKPPLRVAPPPPLKNASDIVKSNSSYTVNVTLKRTPSYTRSSSEDKSARPVVYQSANVRSNVTQKPVHLIRNDSLNCVKEETSLVEKEVEVPKVQLTIANKNKSSFVVNNGCSVIDVKDVTDKEGYLNQGNHLSISRESTLEKQPLSTDHTSESCCSSSNSSKTNSLDKKWDKMLNDRNHVNTLIDEMFASVLEVSLNNVDREKTPSESSRSSSENKIVINNKIEDDILDKAVPTTVIVISDSDSYVDDSKSNISDTKSNSSTNERKVKFNDQVNHELLISELQNQDKIRKRQRKPSVDIYEEDGKICDGNNIHTNDWLSVSDSGEEVKMSTCHITIEDSNNSGSKWNEDNWNWKKANTVDYERISKMSHLHGLPPLPKSLSGFNFLEKYPNPPATPVRTSSIRSIQNQQHSPAGGGHMVYPPHPKTNGDATVGRKGSNLDAQLAILRREMYSLRQQDLSLLSQLWSLNESIQDFRQMLQDQEDRVLSPPSPSPAPSSGEEEEDYYMSATSLGFGRNAGVHARRMSGSSAASGSVG